MLHTRHTRRFVPALLAAACVAAGAVATASENQPSRHPYLYENWQTFAKRDGLPDDHVWTIHVARDHLWVGTDDGLARFDGRTWKSWTQADGLPWPVVSAIDADSRTGDLWIGTWGGGLVRCTAGRFDQFDQFNSGLAGDLVFALTVVDGRVWAATNGGISVFDHAADAWALHLDRHGDRAETAVLDLWIDAAHDHRAYAGCWCEGLRYYDAGSGDWPFVEGVDWAARGDPGTGSSGSPEGRATPPRPEDVPLRFAQAGETLWWVSNKSLYRRVSGGTWESRDIPDLAVGHKRTPTIHMLAARSPNEAWVATSDGLHVLCDWESETWVSYLRCGEGDQGRIAVCQAGSRVETFGGPPTIPHHDVRSVAFQGDDVWVGTLSGLGRGIGAGRWEGVRTAETKGRSRPRVSMAGCGRDAVGVTAPTFPLSGQGVPPEIDKVTIAAGSGMRPIPLAGDPNRPETWTGYVDMAAVQMAIDQVNKQGGYRGRVPFDLVDFPETYTFARYGWGAVEDEIIHTTWLWGAIGVVHYATPGRRIRSAAAQRIGVPIVNAASTAATLDEGLSGWIFRPLESRTDPHCAVLEYVYSELGRSRLGIIRAGPTERSGNTSHWDACLRAAGRSWAADIAGHPRESDFNEALDVLRSANVDAVFSEADALTSAAVLSRLRDAGMNQVFVGGDQIVCDAFIERAGREPGDVVAAYAPVGDAGDIKPKEFAKRLAERIKRPPGLDAYASYQATIRLLEAIQLGGTDAFSIRDALWALSQGGVAHLEDRRWKLLPRSSASQS